MECVLSYQYPVLISSKLTTIPDLIGIASDFYAKNKQNANFGSQIPSDYTDLLSGQSEKLEQFSKHIEEEKEKVAITFDTILKDTVNIIAQMKNEYLSKLDQQLLNLGHWYKFFDKQVRKTYPSEEDIPIIFPSKDELFNKLEKVYFRRSLPEQLCERERVGKDSEMGWYILKY